MAEETSSAKRIAKNTLMLYIRMFISMIVGLYTSRVVLNTLGVEDYGIYGVVGGVISMLGFLNASMSGATSRFITFELGKKDEQRLKDTFSSALIIHIGIALIVLIIAETVGLWFLNNKLVIPAERMDAAHWVYQCSILSAMLSITQVPYNACIIAHERMNIYAYIEILNVTLKLIIVYLLTIGNFDKLKLYAILTLAVSIIIMTIYRIYSIRNFNEAHFKWIWNKEIIKPMLSFSGWDLFSYIGATIRIQGITFLFNIFFGIILNAANSIAQIVTGVLNGFTYNVINASRPQIIKYYSLHQIKEMHKTIDHSLKISLLLTSILSIPLILELQFLMKLWLNSPPPYSIGLCKLLIMSNFFSMIYTILSSGVYATGKNKFICIINAITSIICIIIIGISFYLGGQPYFAYIIQAITFIITNLSSLYLLRKNIPELNIYTYIYCILKFIIANTLVFIICLKLQCYINESFLRVFIIFVFNMLSIITITFIFVLTNKERNMLKYNFLLSLKRIK